MKPPGIPRTGIRIRVAVQAVAVLVVFVLVNYLGFTNYTRIDCSRSQKFVLAAQTRTVLREFKKPVRIVVISSATFLSPVSLIFGDVRNLLKEIQFSGRERVQVEYVDPTRDLTRIRELQGKYKFTNADNLIILDYDGRSRFLNMAEMADFDMRPVAQGDPPRLLAFRGEQALTGALLAIVHPSRKGIFFLQGHGEPALGNGSPIALLVDAIQKQNVKVAPLSLGSSDTFPADAGVLVIFSAKFDLEAREAALIASWLRARGRVIVLLDPDAATPRLHALLIAAGITPHDDRVLRTVRLPFATGILREVTGEILPTTEMTRRLEGLSIMFPGGTQSLGLDQSLAEKEKIQLRPLIQAAEEFWGETDYAPNNPKGVHYDEGRDYGQPLMIAASADRDGVEDDRVEVQTSRLIVVGNARFAFDATISPQGLDFILGAVNSLLDRGKLAGVTPKTVSHFVLNLTDAQLGRLAFFTMLVIPGCAALLGFFVWWRRRA